MKYFKRYPGGSTGAISILSLAVTVTAASLGATAAEPAAAPSAKFVDPVPHQLITQPYRVCQNLDELTARINNLYRKPYEKTIDPKTGVMQNESVVFKDTVSGHEVICITRELCVDISHPDLGRPCWTCDGKQILFEGNRGFRNVNGQIHKEAWEGYKFIMNADYTEQRPLMIRYDPPYQSGGQTVSRTAGIPGKFNIMNPIRPELAYYADGDKLWQVTLQPQGDCVAKLLCTLVNDKPKIIQDISKDGHYLLIQDVNAESPKRTGGKLKYMPEIQLVDLHKNPGEPGFYYHHPMDYGLPEVKDDKGNVIHAADNNFQMHSLMFAGPNAIGWNYGPMTSVGEPLGYSLNIANGLDGTPEHGPIGSGSGTNRWGQYESHGRMIGTSSIGLYFSGPPKGADGKPLPGAWGLYMRDFANPDSEPRFVIAGPGGHVAGGNSTNPDVWAAHMQAASPEWRKRIKESDAIVWGHLKGPASVLCYTYSDVRGGIKRERGKAVAWSGMDNNDFRPYSSIPRPLLSPDGTKLWFHSSMLMPTEDYAGIYVAVVAPPQPPVNLRLAPGASKAQLQWDAAPMHRETRGYHVYRGDAGGSHFTELTTTPIPDTQFTDSTAEAGHTYTYAVTAEEWSTLESAQTSNLAKISVAADRVSATVLPGIKGWDKSAPPQVNQFQAQRETDADGQYRLTWAGNGASDLRHYNIYFSAGKRPEISAKCLLVSPPQSATQYLDWSAPQKTDAHYAITAVDRQGNESPPAFVDLPR
jgi:hypothetical protein